MVSGGMDASVRTQEVPTAAHAVSRPYTRLGTMPVTTEGSYNWLCSSPNCTGSNPVAGIRKYLLQLMISAT